MSITPSQTAVIARFEGKRKKILQVNAKLSDLEL